MALISLVYVSASNGTMSDDDLRDILRVAREKNARLNITGMLLYRTGYFIQVLEGEEAVVMALYDTIGQDPRHQKVLTVHKTYITERTFGDWTMGFNRLEHADVAKMQGFTDFMDRDLDEAFLKKNGERALKLLQSFRDQTYF